MIFVVPSGHHPVFRLLEMVAAAWLSRFFDLARNRSPTGKPHLFVVTQKSADRVSVMCVDVIHCSDYELRVEVIKVSLTCAI